MNLDNFILYITIKKLDYYVKLIAVYNKYDIINQ
jgi:hypothetical protein